MTTTEEEPSSAPPPPAADDDVFIYNGQPRSKMPKGIKHVKVAEGVEIIAKEAFKKHPSLETVTMSSSVKEIEEDAFYECTNLANVVLQNGLAKIGIRAFQECAALVEMNVPETVVEIGGFAFKLCTNLAKVGLHNGLTKIEGSAFYGCTALVEMNVPETVEEIGQGAFYECSNLANVGLQNGLTNIGKYAFAECTALVEIVVPETVEDIGAGAFSGCTNLANVGLQNGLKKIGQQAFYKCTALVEMNAPETVEEIGNWAFQECSNLANVGLQNGLTKIGDGAFRGCTALMEMNVPETVDEIGDEAFRGCTNLANVGLQNGLRKIGIRAFCECRALVEIVVPETVVEIEAHTFEECLNLAKVGLQNGLTKIGIKAFYQCYALVEMNVPETVVEIGEKAFHYCASLEDIAVSGHNVALGIRLRILYPKYSSTLAKKISDDFSSEPIKPSELLTLDEQDAKVLEGVKNDYVKSITESPPTKEFPVAKQHGWVQFVANHIEDGSEEANSLIKFFKQPNSDVKTIELLASAQDRKGRPAMQLAIPSIREVFGERLLLLGRYDLAKGPPMHKSATCVVVKAEDSKMRLYYLRKFADLTKKNDTDFLDKDTFAKALQDMNVIATANDAISKDYFDRVDLDRSGKISEDEFVQFCLDHFGRNVILKFMKNKAQYQRELKHRQSLSTKYVVGVIGEHEVDEADGQLLSSTLKPYLSDNDTPEDYRYILVMPFGDRNLDVIFRSERPRGLAVRKHLMEIAEALAYLHKKKLIHGDLKMLNVVRVNGRLLLIDFDASARIGVDFAAAKFSSGVLAPEFIHQLENYEEKKQFEKYFEGEDAEEIAKRAPLYSTVPKKGYVVKSFLVEEAEEKQQDVEDGKIDAVTNIVPQKKDGLPYDLVKAHPSLDVWSFGVLLYAMCTGQSLFPVNRDDDIKNGNFLAQLCEWDRLDHADIDPDAKKLLDKILIKDPRKRPSMVEVLEDPFFDLTKPRNEEGTAKVLERLEVLDRRVVENQKVLIKLQDSMAQVLRSQQAANSMLKYIIKDARFPKFFVILPYADEESGFSRFIEWVNAPDKLMSKKVRLCFICPLTLQPVSGDDGEAMGYDIELPKNWIKQYGPAILVGLKIVQIGFAAGRGFGLPLPSLKKFSYLINLVVKEMRGEIEDSLGDVLLSTFEGETDRRSSDRGIDKKHQDAIQDSYKGIEDLIRPKKFDDCGLVQVVAKDGTTDFVHPEMKNLFYELGSKCYNKSLPELDAMVEQQRAKARHGANAAVPQDTTVNASFDKPSGMSTGILPPSETLPQERAQESHFDKQAGLGMLESQPETQANQVANLALRLEKQFERLESQVQQSLSIREPIQFSDSQRIGSSIVLEGRFRIKSQSFPRRWNERRVFLYDDLSMKHFPASSGEWLRPSSSGQWQAKKAENGDGVELLSGGKVCTLRLSAKANESRKPPDRQIDEWVAILNSSRTMTPRTDASSRQPSKAAPAKRMVDLTGAAVECENPTVHIPTLRSG